MSTFLKKTGEMLTRGGFGSGLGSGLGSAAARAGAAASKKLEGIRPPSRAAMDDMADAEIARKVDQDMAAEKANKREVDYKKGGVTRADGCITKGHTRGRMV